MTTKFIAMIPQFGELLQGTDYDLVLTDNSVHESVITDLPVDDPRKSFINDMNRDKPVTLNVALSVSTIGVWGTKHTEVDTQRIAKLYDSLLLLKREQVEDPDKLLVLQTGNVEYRNLVISAIRTTRTKDTSQSMVFDLTLKEMRFAKTPVRFEQYISEFEAGNGPVTGQNKRVALEEDRPLLEATVERATGTSAPTTNVQESLLHSVFN